MSSPKLPSLLHDHPTPTLRIDPKSRKIVSANKAAMSLLDYTQRQFQKLHIRDILIIGKDQARKKNFLTNAVSRHRKDIPAYVQLKKIKEKKNAFDLLFINPVAELDLGSDLERNNSQISFDKITRISFHEIYLIPDKKFTVQYANAAALKNLGYSNKELRGLRINDLFTFPDEMALNVLLSSLRTGKSDHLNLQLKFSRKDGSHYDADVFIQFIEQQHLFLFVVTDISAKLIAEKKLLDTIREKDTLIKEIHHRVKNNLQLISSIIYLKLVSLNQSEMRTFLEDTRQKIRSIALIHERLLQTEKLDKVDIADYLGKLLHDLQVTYHKPDLDLQIESKVETKLISLDTAIICGLIVNELVTNSMKHAFSSRSQGVISIALMENIDKTFSLSVADNGTSLPEGILPGKTASFGMQLIDVFVKQLNGSVEINREKGTKFQLQFPV